TCFRFDGRVKDNIRMFRQERRHVSRDRDQRIAKPLQDGDEYFYLRTVSAFRDADDDVFGADHPQIAVDCFRGMKEHRWRSGGVHRGYDFLRDDRTFADSGDDQTPFALINQLNSAWEIVVE